MQFPSLEMLLPTAQVAQVSTNSTSVPSATTAVSFSQSLLTSSYIWMLTASWKLTSKRWWMLLISLYIVYIKCTTSVQDVFEFILD